MVGGLFALVNWWAILIILLVSFAVSAGVLQQLDWTKIIKNDEKSRSNAVIVFLVFSIALAALISFFFILFLASIQAAAGSSVVI